MKSEHYKSEHYKLVASALALETFTVRQLSDHAEVNFNTAKTWLARKDGDIVDRTEDLAPPGPRGGRPKQKWRLRDEAREELVNSLDDLWGALRKDLVSPEEAREAFEDPEARIRIRTHMITAAMTENESLRAEELAGAKEWLEHQDAIIRDWNLNGYIPPDNIQQEIESLRAQIDAFDLGVDRMAHDERMQSPGRIAALFKAGFEAWYQSADLVPGGVPFAPLKLKQDWPLDQQLLTTIAMANEVAGIPGNRLVLALFMCLARMKDGEPRQALCKTLINLEERQILGALQAPLEYGYADLETRRSIVQIMAGLSNFPQFVQRHEIAFSGWLNTVRNSNIWCDEISPFYTEVEIRQRRTVEAQLIESVANSLRRVQTKIENNDADWMSMTDGLPVSKESMKIRIGKWIQTSERNVESKVLNPVTAVQRISVREIPAIAGM